jgi:short-subunit dehydrogenase
MRWTRPPRRLALVTGASSGIGAAFARHLVEQGFDLALTARRADRLELLAVELRGLGAEVLVAPEDLSKPGATDRLLAETAARGRTVEVLINNAGFGLPGAYTRSGWDAQAASLQLMLVSVCELTHRVLPGMLEKRYGRIVNVASLAGLLPGASGHTLYAATKSFLIKFSQSLHLETRGTGVEATAVCPGFTFTEFHDANGTRDRVTAGTPAWAWQDAESVVREGWAAVERGRAVVVTGRANKTVAALAKVLPDELSLGVMARSSARIREP